MLTKCNTRDLWLVLIETKLIIWPYKHTYFVQDVKRCAAPPGKAKDKTNEVINEKQHVQKAEESHTFIKQVLDSKWIAS